MRRPICVIPEHNRLQTTSAHASTIYDYALYDILMHFHLRCFQEFRYSLSQKQNIYNLTIKGKEKSMYPRLACVDKHNINMPFYIRLGKNKAVHAMGLLDEAILPYIYI